MKRIIRERSNTSKCIFITLLWCIYAAIIESLCIVFQGIGYLSLVINYLIMRLNAKIVKDPAGYNRQIEYWKELHAEFLEKRKFKTK